MGLGDRKRYGVLTELLPGKQWRWELPDWSKTKLGKTMDSEKMACFTGHQGYFHLVITEPKAIVGFYVNYKGPPPVPKYTYALGSTKGHVLRQHTAHSIPNDCTRCGHWNVCSAHDLAPAIQKARDDTLCIWFQFDDCELQESGQPAEWMWRIPRFKELRVGPYYSHHFYPWKDHSRSPEQQTVACLKLSTNSVNRSEVNLSVSHRHGHPPAAFFRICSLEGGNVLFETPPGQYHDSQKSHPWPSVSYQRLCEGLGSSGVLVIYARFGEAALEAAAVALDQQAVPLAHSASFARQGSRISGVGRGFQNEDGAFDALDDD